MTYLHNLIESLNPLWLHLPILALAIWRQSRIIRKETGPFAVIYRFRHLFKTYEGKCYDDGGIRELLSCNKCLSLYVGLANLAIYPFPPGKLWVYLFAISAICLYLETGDENWSQHCEEEGTKQISGGAFKWVAGDGISFREVGDDHIEITCNQPRTTFSANWESCPECGNRHNPVLPCLPLTPQDG